MQHSHLALHFYEYDSQLHHRIWYDLKILANIVFVLGMLKGFQACDNLKHAFLKVT